MKFDLSVVLLLAIAAMLAYMVNQSNKMVKAEELAAKSGMFMVMATGGKRADIDKLTL